MWVKLVWKPWISPNLMFPPQRCSLLLLIQPPSVVACLWVSAFSFVLPESTHCWTSKTILFPRLIRSHCKVVPKQFCNWDYSPVHFTLLLLSTVKSSVHTSKPLPLADIFAPCLTHGELWIMGCSFFLHTSSIIKGESKQWWRLFWAKCSLFLSVTRRLHPVHSHVVGFF